MKRVGRVHQINLSIAKGEPRIPIESGELVTSRGLKGDTRFGDDVQLVALPYQARLEIDRSLEPGLCFDRFLETLSIDFEDYVLKTGDVLLINSGRFQVKSMGKRCFPECEILRKGSKCRLSSDVFYLDIMNGTTIACGDSVFLYEEDQDDSGRQPD